MNKLYQPIRINKLELKNRIVMAPMSVGNTKDGFATERDVEFFRRRARGGAGLIVFANIQWDRVRYNPHDGALLFDESYVPSLKKVTDAVHAEGSKMFAQLMHTGRYSKQATHMNQQAVAPSAIPSRYTGYEMPRELTVDEIHEFVDWQAQAAKLAMEAGFDGIEIETNSGYLFGQFFSPLTNKRTDEYGGDLEGRTRFMVETLAAVREAVGPDVPIQIRVSGNDLMPGSCNGDDMAEICEYLDKTGYLDAISVTAGWHESAVPLVTMELPHATWAYLGRQIKKRVGCVVMQGMRLNIDSAERLVESGDVDMAVMGRPFLADPNIAKKATEGRKNEIRPCIGCNEYCLDMIMKHKTAGCIGNAECNNEIELMDENGLLPTEVKSDAPEKILVIGAGPAGMEFARVAALRGHKVTIWEKLNRTIGLTMLSSTPPRRKDIRLLTQWLDSECRRLGVDIVLNKEATVENLTAVQDQYDRVVLACGAKAFMPGISVEEGSDVVNAWDVLAGTASVGRNVVVIGGGATGVETAMFIAEMGTISAEQLRFMMIYDAEPYEKLKELLNTGSKKVSVVEMQHKLAADITPGCRWSIMARCRQLGVDMLKDTRVVSISKAGVTVSGEDGEKLIPADTVVMAAGARPSGDMAEKIQGLFSHVDVVGDAVTVGKIPDAIRSAYNIASKI